MPSESLPLSKARYGVAISWDRAKATVDLDLQALIVDNHGLIVDAVYYNNLSAFNGCIGHSGDKRVADSKEYCESVWVNLTKLPQQVALVIFVVAAYGDCMLKDVTGGKISVLEDWVGYRVKEARIERAMADVDAVFMMRRQDDNTWQLWELEEPPSTGSHFLDILEPTIGDLIRKEIPGAPAVQKVTFIMEKGNAVDFQQSSKLKRLAVGIGGRLPRGFIGSVDLDISAVVFSKAGRIMGAVDCDNCEKYGVSHSGDYVAGHSAGDDEAITIDLGQLPQKAAQIFFVLNVRGGHSFQAVESAYARVADQACTELARYEIVGGANEKGLIIARIFRNSDKRWSLQALGMFCMAESWQELADILKQLFREAPEKVQASEDGSPMPTSRRFCDSTLEEATGAGSQPATTAGSGDAESGIAANPGSAERLHSYGGEGSPAAAGTAARTERPPGETGSEEEEEGPPMEPVRSIRGSRCVTAVDGCEQMAARRSDHSAGDCEGPPTARRRSVHSAGDCEGPQTMRRVVRRGTFQLCSLQDDPVGGRAPEGRRHVKFDPDTDVVPIEDDTVASSAKSRGICIKGCAWPSRLSFLSAC